MNGLRFALHLARTAALALLLASWPAAAQQPPSYRGTQVNPVLCTDQNGNYTGCGLPADQTGSNGSDGQAPTTGNQHALAFNYVWNGTGWDRLKGLNGAAVVTGAVTATPSTGATMATSQATVGTTAGVVRAAGTYTHSEIYNLGTATIYIGAAGVATSTGWPIPAGTSYDASRFAGAIYGIAATTQPVALISY